MGKHKLKGWDVAWPEFCKTFQELHQTHPEWLAITRYLVGVVATAHPNRVKTRRVDTSRSAKLVKQAEDVQGGVLFVPLFDRDYCLGVCYRLGRELRSLAPDEPIHMLRPQGEVPDDMLQLDFYWHPKTILRKCSLAPSLGWRAFIAWFKAVKALRKNPKTRRAMEEEFSYWPLHLAKFTAVYYWEIAAGKRWLKEKQIKVVVTINDVVKPAAPMIVAGNMLGLKTIVLQHGSPGPQSAPFLAQLGWVWGETSKELLCRFGAQPEKLQIVGNLEIDPCYKNMGVPNDKEGVWRLLLLSQWRASTGWGENEFQDFFSTVAKAARESEVNWELYIRLHPNEDEEVKRQIEEKIKPFGVVYSFSPRGTSIDQDMKKATFACSVCSSSIMHAVAYERPCALLLSEALEKRVGTPLLHRDQVVRTGADLKVALDEMTPMNQEQSSRVLAHYGSATRNAAERLLEIV